MGERRRPTAPSAGELRPRTAPWASPDARARLDAVEASLPDDLAATLAAAADAAREHARRVDEDALLLYAGGNVPPPEATRASDAGPAADGVAAGPAADGAASPAADRVAALLSAQPSMGYPGDKYQAGLEALDVVEVAVTRTVAAVMGARFAEVRPTSATLANLAAYTALAQPGDTIAVLPGWAGGHLSHHAIGAAGVRGLRVVELPYDTHALDVDLDRLDDLLQHATPRLVVIGASLMLRAHRVAAIAERVHAHGARLLYDASHVAGLIAGQRFQAPLQEGADLMTFSTYKSFGGPAGGVIATNDEALAERLATAVYPGLTANYDVARLLPLGAAALAHARSGGAYADACIASARALARALDGHRLAVLGTPPAFTDSHHVAVDVRAQGGGTRAARRLAEANILLSEIGCPAHDAPDPAGAIRIGTQSLVREGFTPADMPAIAQAIARGLEEDDRADLARLRDDVAAIRRQQR